MNGLLALFLSIAIVLALSRKLSIGISLLIGSTILSLFTLGSPIYVFKGIFTYTTLNTLLLVFLSFSLSNCMEKAGLLDRLTSALSSTFGGLSLVLIPLLIGLLPMPGGALVSAMMIGKMLENYKIEAEKITFLNYWYRHVWVVVWPLYPNVILATAIVEVDYIAYISATVFIALFAFFCGIFAVRGLDIKLNFNFDSMKKLIFGFYPIIVLLISAALLRLNLLVSLLLAILSLLLYNPRSISGFIKAADWKMLLLIVSVMSYKGVIEAGDVAESFLNDLSFLPTSLLAFSLSFIASFSTGLEMSYASIALPLLTTYTGVGDINPENLMLVVLAGYLGVMLSPLHLCLILTAQYFEANLLKTYRYLIPAAFITALFAILVTVI
ncbi:MAG: DUF401 family protein [Archaeoglobaceae archaeon]